MAIFRYEAADLTGKIMRGAMEAPNAQEVSRRLNERGYQQVQVLGVPSQGSVASPSAGTYVPPMPQLDGKRRGILLGAAPATELASFFRQMASLIHAGFTVGSALSDLGMRTANTGLRKAASAMGAATLNGASVAGQMAFYPALFPEHVIGLVHAGETGGFIEFAFEESALWAEQDAALRQGMWLPKVLIWNAVWTVLLMQPLVLIDSTKLASGSIGTMAHAMDGYGRVLPLLIFAGIAMHVICWAVGKMRHQPFAERFIDGLSLRLPVMAKLAKMRALAAFTRVLRRLLMAGISPAPAYAAAANAVPNAVLRDRLRLGLPIARGGQGLDAAIQATGMMEHDALQMLVTGQKTGQWIEMLDRVTSYYQDEAARATEGAKAAQKRLGWLLTIIVTGYVLCFTTWLCYNIMFKVTDQMAN